MVTLITKLNESVVGDASSDDRYFEGVCLSSDTKPTNVSNGSKLLEMDTSTLYIYDAVNHTWRAWS